MTPHDNCDGCGQNYEFSAEREDVYVIFLKDWACNFIMAHCPYCQTITRIFIDPEALMGLINSGCALPWRVLIEAPPDIIQSKANVDNPQKSREPTKAELDDLQIDLWELENGD